MAGVELILSYEGNEASGHALDFYDAAVALLGFQRSLAITTHFVLNNRVITQAPALQGARLLVYPPEAGSWRVKARVEPGDGASGPAPHQTEALVNAAYDHVLARTLGYSTPSTAEVVELLESRKGTGLPGADASIERFDAVIEKCEAAIRDMHRPIVASRTASEAGITSSVRDGVRHYPYSLSAQSLENIRGRIRANNYLEYFGRISSYNINTYKGRIYISDYKRPIPFELLESARTPNSVDAIIRSMANNVGSNSSRAGVANILAYPVETEAGRLRSLQVVAAS